MLTRLQKQIVDLTEERSRLETELGLLRKRRLAGEAVDASHAAGLRAQRDAFDAELAELAELVAEAEDLERSEARVAERAAGRELLQAIRQLDGERASRLVEIDRQAAALLDQFRQLAQNGESAVGAVRAAAAAAVPLRGSNLAVEQRRSLSEHAVHVASATNYAMQHSLAAWLLDVQRVIDPNAAVFQVKPGWTFGAGDYSFAAASARLTEDTAFNLQRLAAALAEPEVKS